MTTDEALFEQAVGRMRAVDAVAERRRRRWRPGSWRAGSGAWASWPAGWPPGATSTGSIS